MNMKEIAQLAGVTAIGLPKVSGQKRATRLESW